MRVLLSCLPATGHFNSLLPLAEGLTDAGHEVAICSAPSFAPAVTSAGFEHLPGGAPTFQELFTDAPPRSDPDRWRWANRVAFATRAVAKMLPDLERHAREWRPDVLVRESAEYAGYLVAERLGLPHASVATSAWSNLQERRLVVVAELEGWREQLGLPADPSVERPYRYLHLSFMPPRWDAEPVIPTTRSIRYANPRLRQGPPPGWLDEPRDRPLVLASLGTVANTEAGIFEAILEAVADEPISVVAAIGRDQDPQRFGILQGNVRVEPFVPQIEVLGQAAAFITHGGFNSAKEALSLGVPLVVIPISGDQPYTAERVEALGLGRRVGPGERTAEVIRSRLREVLTDPAYRASAGRFAQEMAELPAIDQAVLALQDLRMGS